MTTPKEVPPRHIPIPILYRGDVTLRKIDNGYLVTQADTIHHCKNLHEVCSYLKLVYRIPPTKNEPP